MKPKQLAAGETPQTEGLYRTAEGVVQLWINRNPELHGVILHLDGWFVPDCAPWGAEDRRFVDFWIERVEQRIGRKIGGDA